MTAQAFQYQMTRLRNAYHEKAYPKERVDLIWEEFRTVEDKIFEQIVSRLIAENATAPMLPRFREIRASLRESTWSTEKKRYAEDAKGFGSIQDIADKSISFSQYVKNAVKRNEPTEMKTLIEVFGMDRIERLLEQP